MPPTYKGAQGVTLNGYGYRKDKGWVESYNEEGTPDWINGRALAWQSAGFNVTVDRGGPYDRLRVDKISEVAAVSYIERFSVENEIIEKDIWHKPQLNDEAEDYGSRAQYRSFVEDAVEHGSKDELEALLPVAIFPAAHAAFDELSRGVSSYEQEYAILTMERSLPVGATITLQLTSTRLIYTTTQLSALLILPNTVKFTLPDAPGAAQSQTIWGWRVRDQEAEISTDARVIMRSTWAFAQWSNFLYSPA